MKRRFIAIAVVSAFTHLSSLPALGLIVLDGSTAELDGVSIRAEVVPTSLQAMIASTVVTVDHFPVLSWPEGLNEPPTLTTVTLELDRFDPLASEALVRVDYDDPVALTTPEPIYYSRGGVSKKRGEPIMPCITTSRPRRLSPRRTWKTPTTPTCAPKTPITT